MKKMFSMAILSVMMISGLAGRTAWAAEESAEMTAFERQHAEILTKYQFMKTVQAGTANMNLFRWDEEFQQIPLEAAPYINADGVLMVAAEDLGRFLGWEKTRTEEYWDENGKLVRVQVENKVEWDEKLKKVKIEIPWRMIDHFAAAANSPYSKWAAPMREGEELEPWEGMIKEKDGKLYKAKQLFIEMTVGNNIWRYRGYGYFAGTNCEEKDGRVYLPLKDIYEEMLPSSDRYYSSTRYHWEGETKTLAIVGKAYNCG